MNQTLLILIILCISIGLLFLTKYLKNKNLVKEKDLSFIITAFNLSEQILEQMKLLEEPKAKQISELVIESLDYCKKTFDENANLYELTKEYCYEICIKNGIELNEKQKSIINQLLLILLNSSLLN